MFFCRGIRQGVCNSPLVLEHCFKTQHDFLLLFGLWLQYRSAETFIVKTRFQVKFQCSSAAVDRVRGLFQALLSGTMPVLFLALNLVWFDEISWAQVCQCPKQSCQSCEVQVGLDFYTEPCDGGRVRSCSKPRCRPVHASTGQCARPEDRVPSSVADAEQAPAQLEKVQIHVGTVVEVKGNLRVFREIDGETRTFENVQKSFKVSEKDVLETDPQSKAKILFIDNNILVVAPGTQVSVSHHHHDKDAKSGSTILNLMYGKIRNKISHTNHYDDKQNTFQVRTKTAVAGVRGTDFVTSYDESQGDTVNVQTLSGLVALASTATGEEHPVARGYSLSVTTQGTGSGRTSYFSMPKKLSEPELEALSTTMDFEPQVAKAPTVRKLDEERRPSSAQTVCNEPTADFNQCAWHCKNNPKGAKVCRTDLPEVRCFRSRCAANGKWVDEVRLPASHQTDCPAKGHTVKACNY